MMSQSKKRTTKNRGMYLPRQGSRALMMCPLHSSTYYAFLLNLWQEFDCVKRYKMYDIGVILLRKTHVPLQSRQTDISEDGPHRCSDHLNQSRVMSAAGRGLDNRSDMHPTPIQHEPHCPRGNVKSGNVATARDPESDEGGRNYRVLCQCDSACK